MPSLPPLTQSIGQAENALRAILEHLLAGPRLSYEHWVTLSLLTRDAAPLSRDQLLQRLGAALKRRPAELQAVLEELIARELVAAPAGETAAVALTPLGAAQLNTIRRQVALITERVYGDLPPEDLATTHRVLGVVAERAGRELEG